MPSINILTPISGSRYYHIFNRGINRQNIFFKEENYFYFLKLLERYLSNCVSILAYCLLPNHFHLVVKINEEVILLDDVKMLSKKRTSFAEKDKIQLKNDEDIGKYVSNQFRRLFISYSMAVNKQENRTGSLFDKNFKRLEIIDNEYLKYVIYYTHFNPEKHGVVYNYQDFKFSSLQALLSNKATKIDKKLVYDIFGGRESFINYHSVVHEEITSFDFE